MGSNQQQFWLNNPALDYNAAAPPNYVKADYYHSDKQVAKLGKKGPARAIIIAVLVAATIAIIVMAAAATFAMGISSFGSSNSEANVNTTVDSTLPPLLAPTIAPVTPAPTIFPIFNPLTPAPTDFPTLGSLAPTTPPPVTAAPTTFPSTVPTTFPTTVPTLTPSTTAPTKFLASSSPTTAPTRSPASAPVTPAPTKSPTLTRLTPAPTQFPTFAPLTPAPTISPTLAPRTPAPTKLPTFAPLTPAPTISPTPTPRTPAPTKFPTFAPLTPAPTNFPTFSPLIATKFPTFSPLIATKFPTFSPLIATKFPTPFPSAVGGTCATVNIGEIISPFENSYVQLVFTECPSKGGAQAFLAAATRWSKVIIQNQIALSSYNFDISLTGDLCTFMQRDVIIPARFIFAKLVIFVETRVIDKVGGILASAGPCLLDNNAAFPVVGGMVFDSLDIDALEVSGTLDDVVLHEMGHVLGIGTLWQRNGLLNNPMLITNSNGVTSVNPIGNPQYNGINGRDGFKAVKKLSARPASVPVEDFKFPSGNANPLIGAGSVDGHWDFEDLQPELMVFQIDPSQSFHPLSLVTLKSLQDFAYIVDESQADSFVVSRSSINEVPSSSAVIDLRGDMPGNHIYTSEEVNKAYAARESSGLRGNSDVIVLKYNPTF